MYIIEMHTRHHASAKIVIEKGDAAKSYEEFTKHRLITNHAGDVDEKYCQWCHYKVQQKPSDNRTKKP